MAQGRDVKVSAAEFAELFDRLKRWGRWGSNDERGALHYLTPPCVVSAAQLVREGVSVTLSVPVNTETALHNPVPAVHYMTSAAGTAAEGSGSVHFAKDFVGMDYHNDTHTHIDALCHVAYRGLLYNAKPEATVTEQGAGVDSVEVLEHGLVGRGVLLDIPRLRGVPWLEPGEHIFPEELEEAEVKQGVSVREGDILCVRTGHMGRLRKLGTWDTTATKAGLHPSAMTFISERRVAALGSDGNSDTAPSSTEGVDFPIHVLAINAMGIHLLDYLQFDDLRAACLRYNRWDFLLVASPLRIPAGTGSPVNPLAIL